MHIINDVTLCRFNSTIKNEASKNTSPAIVVAAPSVLKIVRKVPWPALLGGGLASSHPAAKHNWQ